MSSAQPLSPAGRFQLSRFRGWLVNRVVIAYLLAIALMLVGGLLVPGFLAFQHIMTVIQASAFLGLVTLGQSIVIISGKEGLDLSVGGVFVIGVVLSASVLRGLDANLPLALAAVLACGLAFGLVNGAGVSYLGISPLIMTLAWGTAAGGIALFATGGVHIGKASPLLETIGLGSISIGNPSLRLSVRWMVILWVAVIALAQFVLRRTSVGKTLYGIGANNRAAALSGVRTRVFRMAVYGVSGMLSALAGMLLLGYVGEPDVNLGALYILPSVVAAIIGGISFAGGAGSYLGAVAGSIFLTTLDSILATLQLGEGGRQVTIGIVLLLLLASYTRRRRDD
jgi:ribose transport system permease protein